MEHPSNVLSFVLLALGAGSAPAQERTVSMELVPPGQQSPTVSGTVLGADLHPVADAPGTYAGSSFGVDYVVHGLERGYRVTCSRDGVALDPRTVTEDTRGTFVFEELLPLGDNRGTVYLRPREEGLTMTVSVRSMATRRADVEIAGATYRLIVADLNWDGRYGAGDYWQLLETASVDTARGSYSKNSMIEWVEPCYLPNGRCARLRSMHDAALSLEVVDAIGTRSDSMRRRHARLMGRFKQSRAEFLAARSVPGRTKAEEEIEWMHLLSLDEAVTRAKREGKPLLVDCETDWCHWCHVMDAITFEDAEVVQFIREHFVPVKLNFDFAPDALAKELGARAYPTFLVLGPDGETLSRSSGFQPPAETLDWLRTAVEDR